MGRTMPANPTPDLEMAGLLARLERARHALAGRMEIGTADMRLLWLLSDGESLTMRQIGEQLALEQSTVHRQVTAACKEGYLERRRTPGSPAWTIAATPRGLEAFERGMRSGLQVTATGLASLDGAEVDRLIDLLGRFVADYTDAAMGGAGSPTDARDPLRRPTHRS